MLSLDIHLKKLGPLCSSPPRPLRDFTLNAYVSEEQVSHGTTCLSWYRPERLVIPKILWEPQIPPRKLSCPTGDTEWPLELGLLHRTQVPTLMVWEGCDQSPWSLEMYAFTMSALRTYYVTYRVWAVESNSGWLRAGEAESPVAA